MSVNLGDHDWQKVVRAGFSMDGWMDGGCRMEGGSGWLEEVTWAGME